MVSIDRVVTAHLTFEFDEQRYREICEIGAHFSLIPTEVLERCMNRGHVELLGEVPRKGGTDELEG